MNEQEAIKILFEKKTHIIVHPAPALVKYQQACDVALDALGKQIPKKIKLYIGNDPSCPVCNKRLRNYEGIRYSYCKFCGQSLER